jgi:hypothetical protein
MASGSSRIIPPGIDGITPTGPYDVLSAAEIARADSSPFDTPEPGTILLSLAGGAFLIRLRKRV